MWKLAFFSFPFFRSSCQSNPSMIAAYLQHHLCGYLHYRLFALEAESALLRLVGQHVEQCGCAVGVWHRCHWSWGLWGISACRDGKSTDHDSLVPLLLFWVSVQLHCDWLHVGVDCLIIWIMFGTHQTILITITTQSSFSWQTLGIWANSWS